MHYLEKPPFSERIKAQTNTWVSGSFKEALFYAHFSKTEKKRLHLNIFTNKFMLIDSSTNTYKK
ncbi:hypothetical protein MY9_2348 [Bacillus sp. JS]|nr:hypothetical protein MY9_2348 [Bacillus sp. JS]GFM13978.1 uncharacterized protein FW1_contig-04-324 [Bacillus sp. FW1]